MKMLMHSSRLVKCLRRGIKYEDLHTSVFMSNCKLIAENTNDIVISDFVNSVEQVDDGKAFDRTQDRIRKEFEELGTCLVSIAVINICLCFCLMMPYLNVMYLKEITGVVTVIADIVLTVLFLNITYLRVLLRGRHISWIFPFLLTDTLCLAFEYLEIRR